MKKFLLILSGLFLFSASCSAGQAAFMSGFEDLPLMDGLKQAEDTAVSFDTPSGRIIEAYAQSNTISKQKITDFYNKTLPQLGWSRVSGKGKAASVSYTREGEVLTISVDDGTPASVRFELMTREKD
ncbi:MAG: hypothetical protein IJ846_00525 [Alphaproteobacteria bacterium]|nr:hypothetical protein [Alphaproteobacteria bacterium]